MRRMLKVRLLRKKVSSEEDDGVVFGFSVEGHSDFGEPGTDIVCAGVSAIAQTALFGLQDVDKGAVRYEKRSGYLSVTVDPAVAGRDGPRAILRTLELGLLAIRKSYPGTLEFEDRIQ